MSTAQKAVWVVIIVIVVLGGYYWWSSSQSGMPSAAAPAFQPASTNVSTSSSAAPAHSGNGSASGGIPTAVMVTFDGTSFSPANVTVAQGGTVTWVSTSGTLWVASDPHPIHNGYDGTTMQQHCASGYAGPAPFDECAGSSSPWSFSFTQVGTWGYHDHLDIGVKASVTVVAQ